MKKNIRKMIISLLGLIIAATTQLSANDNKTLPDTGEFYATSDQITIISEGIFVSTETGIIQVEHISYVEPGVFLVTWAKECPKHGAYCPKCGGCRPSNICQYRCKCARRGRDIPFSKIN